MAEERVQRRLAAILVADVVEYSRLMGADEASTRTRFNEQLDKIIRPAIDEHRGQLVKTMGDGFLVEFGSVVDAVQCATDIQNSIALQQTGELEARKMLLRMGVHLGDVIVEGDDIHGDGVNIAARLEGLADPGSICISAMVREGVRNKLSLDFTDLGEQSLKNIADPMQVFRVVLEKSTSAISTSDRAIFRRPAVAVLPFENLSGDPEQEYFADGLTEDIITALSLWKAFPVIARNSTFAFKGQSPDIRQVGQELGARYVIEGSVRKAGNRVRVTAQLINAESGHHVWAEKFDRNLDDIFDLQDELTQRIAATVAPEVERVEHGRADKNKIHNLDIWELVHRGMAELYKFSQKGNAAAREIFQRAIEIDPDYADAYVGIAWSYIRDFNSAVVSNREQNGRKAVEAALRAVELNPSDAYAHNVLAVGYTLLADLDKALAEAEMGLQLNPNNANGHITLGDILSLSGHAEDSIAHFEKGLTLNPKDPRNHLFYSFMARAQVMARHYDRAAEWARKAVQWKQDAPFPHLTYSAALGHLGKIKDAKAELDICEQLRPAFTASADNWHQFKNPEDQEHFLDGLRKAGWEG